MRSFKHKANNNITFYVDCTQKECINYLSQRYGKSKRFFLDFIRSAKNNNYVWDCLEIMNNEITFIFKNNRYHVLESFVIFEK